MWSLTRWLANAMILLGVAVSFACGSAADRDEPSKESLPPDFLTPVAAAQETGLQVYWVGERFEVAGLAFRAMAASLEGDEETPALQIFYEADFEGDGSVAFTLGISRTVGYEEAIDRQLSRPGGVSRQETTVRGWPATLFERAVGRWTNRVVIVDVPGSPVRATANASIADGCQVNPLNAPEQLLAVLENLRPYPE